MRVRRREKKSVRRKESYVNVMKQGLAACSKGKKKCASSPDHFQGGVFWPTRETPFKGRTAPKEREGQIFGGRTNVTFLEMHSRGGRDRLSQPSRSRKKQTIRHLGGETAL